MKQPYRSLAYSAVACLAIAGTAQAQTETPPAQDAPQVQPLSGPGVVTITTAEGRGADAAVFGGKSAGNNFGTDPRLPVKSIDYSIKKAYLQFDLSPVLGKKVGAAQLVLTTSLNHADAQTIQVYAVEQTQTNEWNEAELTYDTAPGNVPEGGGRDKGVDHTIATPVGELQVTKGADGQERSGVQCILTSEELAREISERKSPLLTLILVAVNTQQAQDAVFASKEGDGEPPTLLVQVTE